MIEAVLRNHWQISEIDSIVSALRCLLHRTMIFHQSYVKFCQPLPPWVKGQANSLEHQLDNLKSTIKVFEPRKRFL